LKSRHDVVADLFDVHGLEFRGRDIAVFLQDAINELDERLDVVGQRNEPHIHQRAHQSQAVAVNNGAESSPQPVALRPRDAVHHAEIHQDDLRTGCDKDVAGVRVAVEQPVAEEHLSIGLCKGARDLLPVDALPVDLVEIGDLDAGEIFKRQDLGCGERPVHERDPDLRIVREVPGKGLGVLALLEIVQLFQDDPRELGIDHVDIDMAVDHAKNADDELKSAHVRGDHVIDARILDLDHDAVAVAQAGAVHLAKRGGRDGRLVKGRKDLVHGPQLLGDPLDDIVERRRRHLVLELRELARVLLGQKVDA